MCLPFVVAVLLTTALWVYYGRKWSFTIIATAMYFPAVYAFLFVDGVWYFTLQVIGYDKIKEAVFYSAIAVIIVYVVVYGCVALDLSLGWAEAIPDSEVPNHPHKDITGYLRATGEEIGWRCYLLPCLLWHFSPPVALLISGVAWGLFHVPVMILLTSLLKPQRPITTIVVQSLSCIEAAFPFGWLAIKCGFSAWPCAVMHALWNRLNPDVLGSIYMQTPGKYKGEQWKINGEGLAGCLVYLPVCALVIYDLS
ncbi:hypothetical protein FSP39_024858 [Pinctada imbricata]|uniref:CAAX prenyl protease 2/Lysostaphin resistance protein A-like domain-containing protein n=1 Tax=Pinctada imbricata TaxID=66713 RepID=A0AA88XQT2_PINIB|nr:hypothetical protein FSP39_024858 [Pinctada imbricata]